MDRLSVRSLLSLTLACTISPLMASSAAIGLATATGSFQVNTSTVWGNTTLFDGTVVETSKAPSQLTLHHGAQLRLAGDSRATVYSGRVVLEKGGGQLQAAAAYPLEARSLRVQAASAGTVARVQLAGGSQVVVTALLGGVRVTNAAGVLVARLEAGHALSFNPQAEAAASTKVSGCLLRKDGKFLLVDQTTNVALEVRGSGLEKEAGNQVELTGTASAATPSMAGASQVIDVQAVRQISKGGCASVGKKVGGAVAGGAAAGGAAAAAGIGTAATVAVVGGVAAAATVGGLAAAGSFSGDEARPATSR